ncbi:hypothetical protein N7530_011539, partial [Penicillium desertorum]
SPRSDLDSQPFSPPLFLFFPFPSFATPFLYNSFVSFVWVIVRLYFLARHTHFVRASIPWCSLSRSDDLRSLKSYSTSPINRI